jgi:tRNA 2-(methylsulfanyl)-N6-isopentenyladenosine37 hydroxylase
MKLSLDLKTESPKAWVEAVMADFNSFLQDHADCERKASAMAMSFVARYPDRQEILPELIETGIEELQHFQQVYELLKARGVMLTHEIQEDSYIKKLLALCRTGRDERFMDRLLLASIIECRGAERFRLVYEALEAGEEKKFYHNLWASEAKHGNIFVKMALVYFPEEVVYKRLNELNEQEGEIIKTLPIRAALH